jgi:hypothetical protein
MRRRKMTNIERSKGRNDRNNQWEVEKFGIRESS